MLLLFGVLLRSSLARPSFHWLLSETIIPQFFYHYLIIISIVVSTATKNKKLFKTSVLFSIQRQTTRTTACIPSSLEKERQKTEKPRYLQ